MFNGKAGVNISETAMTPGRKGTPADRRPVRQSGSAFAGDGN
jgi:hypothetical protein